MPNALTDVDSLREFLSGAASDGADQPEPHLSFGGYRAAQEASGLGMVLKGNIRGVQIQQASCSNPIGKRVLVASSTTDLTWWSQDLPGETEVFTEGVEETRIIGGYEPEECIRVLAVPPFVPGRIVVTLDEILENVFGFDNITNSEGVAGVNHYSATVLKNLSQGDVHTIRRSLKELAVSSISSQAQLGGSGSGTLQSANALSDWPQSGWCQVRNAGAIREVVYYTSRTEHVLTVPSAGRGLLGTSATAGASTDTIHAVPGLALALSVSGVQASGSSFATIANYTTAPAGVTWNLGISDTTGLQIARMAPGQQIGLWMRRHIPAGATQAANVYNRIRTRFLIG